MDYPVVEIVPQLKQALRDNPIVILQAPPGAGKSTIVPLQLIDEPWLDKKKIIMLEPRRLAARSVAMRMAELRNSEIGREIGYRVRFESRVSEHTEVEVVTEGILTRMIQQDNSLENIGLIIFDEFHERSLQADLALALAMQVGAVLREDLRILIMSATLDSEKLSQLLNAPVVTSLGRQFPVDIIYHQVPDDAPIHVQVTRAIKKALRENSGDILVFLPGTAEIMRTTELLANDVQSALVFPLFGDLPFEKQQEAILPNKRGLRKIVLATSIAETSLTIEGIGVVIDSGYARVPKFDPRTGLSRLETVRITKDAADQRAGRAGRLGPGVCYRLWTQGIHINLKAQRTPEILEADLAPIMLELFQWGVKNIEDLTWITPPPRGSVNQAIDLLKALEAVEGTSITERGRQMLKLPTHPRIAHMLIEAGDNEKDLASDVAALLEERDPFSRDANVGSDLSVRVATIQRWRKGERVNAERSVLERIEKLSSQWRRLLKSTQTNSTNDFAIGRMIMAAYPERIARQLEPHSERFKLLNNRIAVLPKHDPLTREPWIAVAQLDAGSGEGKIFLAAPLDEKDLFKHAREHVVVKWDEERGMISGTIEKRVGSLTLQFRPQSNIPESERVNVICQTIREKGLRLLKWDEVLVPWQARVLSLKKWRREETWPDVSDETLLETLEQWLAPFLTNVSKRAELEKLPAQDILTSILPWELQSALERLAPQRIQVPSGSNIVVHYSKEGSAPLMEVRLQEVFGLLKTPAVNEGRTPIVLHLLSPGYKPVQVTQDLHSFWSHTYAEVRKELRMRYPKHSWPEDPWTAQAVRGVKRK